MGKDEVSVKKRRKLNTAATSDAPKQPPVDVYKVRILKQITIIL